MILYILKGILIQLLITFYGKNFAIHKKDPFHKKGAKQILKNYRPISLLPIGGKTNKRLLYDRMLEVFIANNLISKNQSGFRPSDSDINELLSINLEIYRFFDENL